MFHGAASEQNPDPAASYKSRLGVWMFVVYGIVYAGFVAINVIKPCLMERRIILGLNLAVFYGFGLIAFALALALLYNNLCSRREKDAESSATAAEERI